MIAAIAFIFIWYVFGPSTPATAINRLNLYFYGGVIFLIIALIGTILYYSYKPSEI